MQWHYQTGTTQLDKSQQAIKRTGTVHEIDRALRNHQINKKIQLNKSERAII